MRKRQVAAATPLEQRALKGEPLDLDQLAVVEVSSEDAANPIEGALVPGESSGWSAAAAGPQTVRIIFDQPQRLRRIELVFEEHEVQRTQEFALRWAPDTASSPREIVRQQYNFSPPHTTREAEEYNVDLANVVVIEIAVVPDISRGSIARASLKSLRVF